ncbi:hypothetical protein [Solitalea canadensis]|uniref:Lipoprotein n=1 Tax=Solitalea canadensis (strain ATCC 29591 / DSM 3403 / JCM 21819 / LMG 8368 / NBRC 15130 / NCIMB 12057 / USAM 9D) TaxID=929556 RepID=H8KLW9_SOLCM|nr:hypothetical protein [Solitalea canadensis]AFD08697.1 hypothetical protein Solca_3694 [Solitalea canadensis DSM 3403]
MKYVYFFLIFLTSSCKQNPDNKQLLTNPPQLVEFGVLTLALSDSTKIYDVLRNKDAYEILNVLISENNVTEDSLKVKLIILTAECFKKENLSKNNLNLLDSLGIKVPVSRAIFQWDSNKLKNVRCISFQDAIQIFRGRSIKLSWHLFRQKYGPSGLHAYSVPLMNKSGDIAVLFHVWNGEERAVSTDLFVLKKLDNKWMLEEMK